MSAHGAAGLLLAGALAGAALSLATHPVGAVVAIAAGGLVWARLAP